MDTLCSLRSNRYMYRRSSAAMLTAFLGFWSNIFLPFVLRLVCCYFSTQKRIVWSKFYMIPRIWKKWRLGKQQSSLWEEGLRSRSLKSVFQILRFVELCSDRVSIGPSMSFYPHFILILSWLYPDFILILSRYFQKLG